jgi:septum formation protein
VDRPRLVLASASPARQKLLDAAGIDCEVLVSGVDESTVDASKPEALSLTLARLKAQAVARRLVATGRAATTADGPRLLVLGCDSVLDFDGHILGKPADAADATRRWRAMRGAKGVLHTGHCLIDVGAGKQIEAGAATTVHFADIDDDEIDAYVATGEPLAVAGAFTVDGLGAPFIAGIEGDQGTVIGLSLPLLRTMLADLGVRITDLWRPALT